MSTIDLPLRNLKLLVKSSNICYDWVSSNTHLASGPHLFIWFTKRHQVIGDLLEIIEPSIISHSRPSSQPTHSQFFCYLNTSKLTTKYQCTQMIHPKLLLPLPPLDYLNLLVCPFASETQLKHSKD